MAVVIRLSRHGRKKKPFYRVVAADQRFSRDGRFLEILGTYDPASKVADIKKDAAKIWVRKGARLSPTVKRLLAIPDATGNAVADATGNVVADATGNAVADATGNAVADATGNAVADATGNGK